MGRPRWTNRLTVEQCPIHLPVEAFSRASAFDSPPGTFITNTLSWTQGGDWQARAAYRIEHGGPTGLRIVIHSQNLGISVITAQKPLEVTVDWQAIPVTITRPNLGGRRYWFLCECGKRVGRLYLPFGQRVFRCRICHNLTYESAQEHDKRKDALLRNPELLKAAMRSADLRKGFLAVGAVAQYLGRMRKHAPC